MTRRHGFTLLELTTSIAISISILLAVAAAFTATQTIYQREANQKSAVENARIAINYLERTTKLLGYGIDPRFAIDVYGGNLAVGGKSNYVGAANTTTGIQGYITDDFAFRYRDPSYLRFGTLSAARDRVDIVNTNGGPADFGINLQAGRLMLISCRSGVWAVVRTTAVVTPAMTGVGVADANVALNPTSFPTPPSSASAPCLNTGGVDSPSISLVRESRIRVLALGTAPNVRPYLVSYNSINEIDVGNTAADFDPIAADVESFHVSYVMNRSTTGLPIVDGVGGDWILGNASTDSNLLPTATGARPMFDSAYSDPLRFGTDVANVRAVTFDLGVRSIRVENRRAHVQHRLADDPTAAIPPDGYYHTSLSTTVRTPNMMSRSAFLPLVRTVKDTDNALNFWGG